jgi:hypothetical protein
MVLKQRSFWYTMALFGVIIGGLQFYGGAYEAEFDAHPDEAAHFVSSLLIRDYIGQWPWPDPMPWAARYYIHYPKVAIGHWPPGYYMIQAAWWVLFPPGRASAMWLNIVMGVLIMGLFFTVARRIRDSWTTAAAGVAVLFLPIMQEAHAQVMAELPALLFAMCLLWGLTRLIEDPCRLFLVCVLAALAGALIVKGTGVALAAAPVIAVALSGVWRRIPRRYLIAWPLAAALGVASLLLWQYKGAIRPIIMWGGVMSKLDWGVKLLPEITGVGILALAAVGAGVAIWRRQPVAVAALSITASILLTSYFVRAMRETRHWIAIVPMLMLLALAAYAWLERRTRWAPLAAVAVLATYPYAIYQQRATGFAALAAQVRQPARMLFSSPQGWREGPWIAIVCLREPRPSSTIVRATKLLSASTWNGGNYRALVSIPEEVEQKLDEMAIDLVVLERAGIAQPPGEPPRPHHHRLAATLQSSPAWKPCGAAGELIAYCRVAPPRFPRQPLRFHLMDRLGRDIEETLP